MGESEIDIKRVAAFLSDRVEGRVPDVAVVCGSGLASLAEGVQNKTTISFEDVPTYPSMTVPGHVGEFVFGEIGDKFVILLRGRLHYYEGHSNQTIAAQIRVFAALGAKVVVVTNAAGGVNPNFSVGDFMAIKDHIYFPGMSGNHPLRGHNDGEYGPRFPSMNSVYDPALLATLKASAEAEGVSSKLREGVYCGLSGPSFETAHEIGALRILGGDAVGMSTVPEVIAAAHAGLKVLGVSLITNECLGPGDDPDNAPTHDEVLQVAKDATKSVVALVMRAISDMDISALPRSKAYGLPPATATAAPAAAAAAVVSKAPAAPASAAAPSLAVVGGVAAAAGAVAGALVALALAHRKQ